MPPVIDSVSPDRVRAGDVITVNGSGFAPVFGNNRVDIGGANATIVSESETQIICDVPGPVPSDVAVRIVVSRTDSQEFSDPPALVWSADTLANLRTVSVPGQIPGPREAVDVTASVPDVQQAQDYERVTTFVEHQRGRLTSKGDIYTSDGSTPVRLPMPAGAGMILTQDSSAPLGSVYMNPKRQITLLWGKEINIAASNDGPMVANGDSSPTSVIDGEHGAAVSGTIVRLWVLVLTAGSGNTLDQVRVLVNGGVAYDSGAGLGLTVDGSHLATVTIAITVGDLVILEAFKLGAGSVMNLVGGLRIEELQAVAADSVEVSDLAVAVKTGIQNAAESDVVAVADAVAVT